jgi:hypothetical protein
MGGLCAKLGVSSGADAVTRARQLGLLQPVAWSAGPASPLDSAADVLHELLDAGRIERR